MNVQRSWENQCEKQMESRSGPNTTTDLREEQMGIGSTDLTQPNYLSPDQTHHKWSLFAHEAHFKNRRAPKWAVCIRALHYIKWSVSCSFKYANRVGKYSMMPSSPREGREVSEPLGFWNKLSTRILFELFFLFHHDYKIFNNCSKWLKNTPQCMG